MRSAVEIHTEYSANKCTKIIKKLDLMQPVYFDTVLRDTRRELHSCCVNGSLTSRRRLSILAIQQSESPRSMTAAVLLKAAVICSGTLLIGSNAARDFTRSVCFYEVQYLTCAFARMSAPHGRIYVQCPLPVDRPHT